jgi:maltooligosyltrehalose trehalohydrolase
MTPEPSARLGATPVEGGVRFEVWAPNAAGVDVVADDGRTFPLTSGHAGPGTTTWAAVVADLGSGDRYRFRLHHDDGSATDHADPASRRQPDGVHGASAVVDTAAFEWTDEGWDGIALADTVLYELHVGTFTRSGTFDSAIDQLDRLAALGVTTIEVMPVNAFPGARNWGYDGVFAYAVQESYGGPAAFARFIDAAHARGLGVVLDVVYNHFGPEGNVLPEFGPYLTDAYDTPWGEAVNVSREDSDAVRRYLIDNAVGWVEDFHLDGLRLDAVHAIVDLAATTLVQELTTAVHDAAERSGRTVLVTLESAANDPRMVRSRAEHGWGSDAVWNDDVHHCLRVALTGEHHEYYAAYDGVGDLAAAYEHRWVYRGQHSPTLRRRHGAPADDVEPARFIVFSQNHDHNGNTPRGERLLHDAGPADPRLRLAAAAILLSPFTPMLFMGEEYGERAPFPYFIDHGDADLVERVRQGRRREFAGNDWSGRVADPADPATFDAAVLDPSLADHAPHAGLLAMYTELLRLRREHRVLTDPSANQSVESDATSITVQRESDGVIARLVMTFGGAPTDHDGVTTFDTDDPRWSGDPLTADGRSFRAVLTISP